MKGAGLLLQPYQYPNLSEGADRVAGQLRGDKECPFSGVTKSGRVWRKVPESDARSVPPRQPIVSFENKTTRLICRELSRGLNLVLATHGKYPQAVEKPKEEHKSTGFPG